MCTEDPEENFQRRITDTLSDQRQFMKIQMQLMEQSQERLEDLLTFAENVEILLP